MNLLPITQVAHQRFQSGMVRPFSDDAALKLGKRWYEICDRSQNKFMTFAAQQVADHQNFRVGRAIAQNSAKKELDSRRCVRSCWRFPQAFQFQDFLHLAADTYHGTCRAIDVHRHTAPPVRRNPTQKATVKHIQPWTVTTNGIFKRLEINAAAWPHGRAA